MRPLKRLVVVAGEESGDRHAASFIRELKLKNPDINITGIGGEHMQDAGVHLISSLARHGVTGYSEVIRHLRVIKQAFKDIKAHLKANKPDLLVLVDYPGFNLRLAKFAKKRLGIRILYYISPQIWAWKASRIHTIRDCVDKMAVIFPFEKKLYEQAEVPAAFVGHPLLEKIKNRKGSPIPNHQLALPKSKPLIAMLPGSRTHEIERHMPVLIESAKIVVAHFSDVHFVIPVAETINLDWLESYFTNSALPYTLTKGNTLEVIARSDFAVVASGTASLECALLEKPMCIIYKASPLSYMVASQVVKVQYIGLCNLLQNQMIVPELLQDDCNPKELTRVILDLLQDQAASLRMVERLERLKSSLSMQKADCTITSLIEDEMNCKQALKSRK